MYGEATAYSTNENPSTDKLNRAINYNEVPSRFLRRNENIEFLFSRMMEEVLGKLSTLEVDMKGVQVKACFTFYK